MMVLPAPPTADLVGSEKPEVPDLRGDIDVRTTNRGVLVAGTNTSEGIGRVMAFEVDWEENILWQSPIISHHHIHKTSDGHFKFMTGDRRYFTRFDYWLMGNQIIEWDPVRNHIAWEWHLLDHHLPECNRRDNSHSNTTEPDWRIGSLYLSCRNMNTVLNMDPESDEIIWCLGEHGDFGMYPEDRLYHQHSPELQSNGSLLISDDGMGQPEGDDGEYSRAVELGLDEANMRARTVWTYRHVPDLFCPIWSDADRLPNGNTVIVFGTRSPMDPVAGSHETSDTTRYVEVAPDGEVVWEVELCPGGWGTYRAERILRENPNWV